jgi:hypothetical protein
LTDMWHDILQVIDSGIDRGHAAIVGGVRRVLGCDKTSIWIEVMTTMTADLPWCIT